MTLHSYHLIRINGVSVSSKASLIYKQDPTPSQTDGGCRIASVDYTGILSLTSELSITATIHHPFPSPKSPSSPTQLLHPSLPLPHTILHPVTQSPTTLTHPIFSQLKFPIHPTFRHRKQDDLSSKSAFPSKSTSLDDFSTNQATPSLYHVLLLASCSIT